MAGYGRIFPENMIMRHSHATFRFTTGQNCICCLNALMCWNCESTQTTNTPNLRFQQHILRGHFLRLAFLHMHVDMASQCCMQTRELLLQEL